MMEVLKTYGLPRSQSTAPFGAVFLWASEFRPPPTAAAAVSGFSDLSPAFWSAFGTPARRISLKGSRSGNGKTSPLREKASAAYGIGRDSAANALAVRCPV